MTIHTIRDYLLFMFFSFMVDYIKSPLALAISFQSNFDTQREEILKNENTTSQRQTV